MGNENGKLFHRGWKGKFFYDSKSPYFTHNRGVPLWYLQKLGFDSIEYFRYFFLLKPKEKNIRYNIFIVRVIKLLKKLELNVNWYIYKIFTIDNGLKVLFRVEWDDLKFEKQKSEAIDLLDKIIIMIKKNDLLCSKVTDKKNSKVAIIFFDILNKNGGIKEKELLESISK
jgi:hypothetical protein